MVFGAMNSISQYFAWGSPAGNTLQSEQQPPANQPTQSQSWAGAAYNTAAAPFHFISGETVQGAIDRIAAAFQNNQPQIAQNLRSVVTDALVRRIPNDYSLLVQKIQPFLATPTQADLTEIKRILGTFTEARIRELYPQISPEELLTLTWLRARIDEGVVENPPGTLTISNATREQLTRAKGILELIINSYEGAFIYAMNTIAQGLSATDGVVAQLRHQLTEGINHLRRGINSTVDPHLRASKRALDALRTALTRSESAGQITPLLRSLHEKLTPLCSNRASVQQVSDAQFLQLQQFHASLPPLFDAPPADLLQRTEAAFAIIYAGFNAQRGVIEEATDTLFDALGRGMFETLPNQAMSYFATAQAPAASAPAASSPPPAQPPATGTAQASTPGFLNLGTLLSRGEAVLQSLMSSAGNALSRQGASALATTIRFVFEKIRDHIQQSNANLHLLTTIEPLIVRLQGGDQGSWMTSLNAIQDGFRFIQQQQIYLQGIRIPINPFRPYVPSIPNFLENIASHEAAFQSPQQRAPERVTPEMVAQQAALLKARSAAYSTAWLPVKICSLSGSESFFTQIFRVDSLPLDTDFAEVFRARLFERIDRSEANAVFKWLAKRAYDLLLPLSNFYTESLTDELLTFARESIPKTQESRCAKEEFLIKTARNWLAITSSAYNEVANTSASQSRDLPAMLEECLTSPERNGGLTQEELRLSTVKAALDTFGPRITWDQKIANYFNTEIPLNSSLHFLNPVVKVLNGFCSFALRALVFIPQAIGNFILQGGAKFALSHTRFLNEAFEKTVQGLQRNSPASYAMYRVIYRQLHKLVALLQQNLGREDEEGIRANNNTNAKNIEIKRLIEYFNEVLNKSQYATQDRLHNYLNHLSPIRDRAERELEDTFLPEIMDSIVKTTSIALETMTDPNELQRLLYDSLSIVNGSFEAQQPVTDEEFASLQRGIRELANEILETVLYHTIAEKLDFTNDKQRVAIRHFMQTFKEQTTAFTTQISGIAGQLSDGCSAASADLLKKSAVMIEKSTRYNQGRIEAMSKVDGNRHFNTETKSRFNALSREISEKCARIAEHLNTAKKLSDETFIGDQQIFSILACRQIGYTIESKLRANSLSADDARFCKIQLSLFQNHLNTLREAQLSPDVVGAIAYHCQALSSGFESLENRQKAEEILRQAHLLFTQLKDAKLAALSSSPSSQLTQRQRQLSDLLNTLSFTDQKSQMSELVQRLMNIERPAEAEEVSHSYFRATQEFIAANSREAARTLGALTQENTTVIGILTASLNDVCTSNLANRATIAQKARELTEQSRELQVRAQNENDPTIADVFLVDMEWINQIAKDFAFARAKPKIDQIIDTFSQRHLYVSFANQVVLLPFVQQFGPSYLN